MSEKIRNVAIIAHVDHGKTTLVDAILRQCHVERNVENLGERIMDSMDLEKEKGITIRAKNASIVYHHIKINIIDTPGHADFGGEVERTLRMADGVLLLVDAKDGPMPQTRFVLKKALEIGHHAIVVINKVDRPESRLDEVLNETFDLFCELGASNEQCDFSVVYASALEGWASLDPHQRGSDILPLLDLILKKVPPPQVKLDAPLQMLALALEADSYKGKLCIGKLTQGSVKKGDNVLLVKRTGEKKTARVTAILVNEGLAKREVDAAHAGEIVTIAGFDDVGIGDTLTDTNDPAPLPPPAIDEPTVRMTFAVNSSPFSGREGKFVTSRVLRERLMKELETNVSLRVSETDSPDTFLVSGRGELHLAILIEQMRREGYELEVSQPEVILHEEHGVTMEPYEFLVIDVPNEYQGAIIEELGKRKANLKNMLPSPTGELHFEYTIPTRGVIGLKSRLMTLSRGNAIAHHVFDSYKPYQKENQSSEGRGSLVAIEDGESTAYALNNCQERGTLFIGPGVEVYTGMIIGECARSEDLNLSPCKTKKLTNMRASGTDDAIILAPPREISLEYALEYIGPDDLVEVTPKSLRLRKKVLDPTKRKRARRDGE